MGNDPGFLTFGDMNAGNYQEEWYEWKPREFTGIVPRLPVTSAETVPEVLWKTYFPDQLEEWARQQPVARKEAGEANHPPPIPNGIYRPITDQHEMRVLEIHPGARDDDLCGTLHHCSIGFEYTKPVHRPGVGWRQPRNAHAMLMDNPEIPVWYTALSYTWGPPVFDSTLVCNGHPKKITRSLDEALRHFRREDTSILMWIDQICMDQEHNDEKAHQIQLMGRIYRYAFNTVIWVGPSDHNTEAAISLIQNISEKWHELPSADAVERVGLPALDAGDWKGCWNLMARAWFSRLWTVQEAVLSSEPWIMCGEHILEFEVLADLCRKLSDSELALSLTRRFADSDKPSDQAVPFWHASQLIQQMRSSMGGALVSASNSTRYTESWDARDKIYGILGIVGPDRRLVRISYKKDHTPAITYLEAALSDIARSKTYIPAILTSVDHEPYAKFPDLPSWVPDWSQPRLTTSLGYTTSSRNMYNASAAEESKRFVIKESHPEVAKDAKDLIVQARTFDTISFLEETCIQPLLDVEAPRENNEELAKWLTTASTSQACRDRYEGHVFEAFWRTLVADTDGKGRERAPVAFAEVFSLVFDETMGTGPANPSLPGQTYSARQQRPVGKGKLELSSLLSRKPAETLAELRQAMGSMLKHRRVGYTETGYVGLFPRYARVGDVTSVIAGLHVPFVLRARQDGKFTLVGECYVHGVMGGEVVALDAVKTERILLA